MSTRHRLRLLAVVGALAGAGCTIYPNAVPADPAYDTDVLPIFEAHCTRCHGAGPDGGALNPAWVPGVDYGDGGFPNEPVDPCLTVFAITTPSMALNGCGKGAGARAVPADINLVVQPGYDLRMPPPPAPSLNDWELAVIGAWANESTTVCSHSSNPDPALNCPAM